jgi:hypothetical protein
VTKEDGSTEDHPETKAVAQYSYTATASNGATQSGTLAAGQNFSYSIDNTTDQITKVTVTFTALDANGQPLSSPAPKNLDASITKK